MAGTLTMLCRPCTLHGNISMNWQFLVSNKKRHTVFRTTSTVNLSPKMHLPTAASVELLDKLITFASTVGHTAHSKLKTCVKQSLLSAI